MEKLGQLSRLPDGVRDCGADHILIEFKYTESVGLSAFQQAAGYDYFYKSSKKLTNRQVQTFLISSKTVQQETLDKFSYFSTDKSGVLMSGNPMLEAVPMLILNNLSKEPHNAYIKCFASRIQEKRAAFNTLKDQNAVPLSVSAKLNQFLQGLRKLWLFKGGAFMELMELIKRELTPEIVMEMGKEWGDLYLSSLPPEERLKGLEPEERLKGLEPEERLKGLEPEERLKGLAPEDVFKNFRAEDVLKNFRAEERLKGLGPEERLKGLSAKEIEAHLRKLKKKK